jgi:hypothetical protein
MGAVAPVPWMDDDALARVEKEIVRPVLDGMVADGTPFTGTLYAGIMWTDAGPKVLEFNARFGDPETQVIVARMRSDIVPILQQCASGTLGDTRIEWAKEPAVCVVLASKGYPDTPETGKVISGLDALKEWSDVVVYHAATKREDDGVKSVGGRVLGVTALGAYRMAWGFSTAPMQKIVEIVTRVTPAVFSAVQSDHAALRRYVLIITEALATVTFPASVGLALVADDFVRVVLGPAWIAVILPLRLLAGYIALRTISTIPSQVLTVIGDTRFTMKNGVLAVLVMPLSFLIGSRWGAAGVATAWIIAYPAIVAPVYVRLFRRIGMTVPSYLTAIGAAASGTAAMAAAVLLARWILPAEASPVARLAAQVGLGAAAYGAWGLAFHRNRLGRLLDGVRRIRG